MTSPDFVPWFLSLVNSRAIHLNVLARKLGLNIDKQKPITSKDYTISRALGQASVGSPLQVISSLNWSPYAFLILSFPRPFSKTQSVIFKCKSDHDTSLIKIHFHCPSHTSLPWLTTPFSHQPHYLFCSSTVLCPFPPEDPTGLEFLHYFLVPPQRTRKLTSLKAFLGASTELGPQA